MLAAPSTPTDSCRVIKEGDLVIVYEGHEKIKSVRVTQTGQLENSYGHFKLKDWIGVAYGSRVWASRGQGYVHLLAPTPELWTQVLTHRTQILYIADISLIVAFLELRPGSVVLESGTGSGSLTTSLARAVAPTGRVHTFEFHEQRATIARDEFEKNGLSRHVTLELRDVQGQGFPQELEGRADAIFLDLPGPWNVVPSAARCLRSNRPFCSFSPCIEQVQRTCEALAQNAFVDLKTYEILLRTYEVRREHLVTDLSPMEDVAEPAPSLAGEPDSKLECIAEPAVGPMVNLPLHSEAPPDVEVKGPRDSASPAAKRPCVDTTEQERQHGAATSAERQEDAAMSPDPASRARKGGVDRAIESRSSKQPAGIQVNGESRGRFGGRRKVGDPSRMNCDWQMGDAAVLLARPLPETKGHTGYLTFARKRAHSEGTPKPTNVSQMSLDGS